MGTLPVPPLCLQEGRRLRAGPEVGSSCCRAAGRRRLRPPDATRAPDRSGARRLRPSPQSPPGVQLWRGTGLDAALLRIPLVGQLGEPDRISSARSRKSRRQPRTVSSGAPARAATSRRLRFSTCVAISASPTTLTTSTRRKSASFGSSTCVFCRSGDLEQLGQIERRGRTWTRSPPSRSVRARAWPQGRSPAPQPRHAISPALNWASADSGSAATIRIAVCLTVRRAPSNARLWSARGPAPSLRRRPPWWRHPLPPRTRCPAVLRQRAQDAMRTGAATHLLRVTAPSPKNRSRSPGLSQFQIRSSAGGAGRRDEHVGVTRQRRAPAPEHLAPQLAQPDEPAGLERQVVIAIASDHGLPIAVLAQLERVPPRRGAVHSNEIGRAPWPRRSGCGASGG